MEGVDDIFDVVLQYEMQNNLQDVAAPDELEDIQLSPEELLFLEKEANKLPPVPEGKIVSPSMVNFARTVTKAYRLCFFQFMQYVDNTDGLCPDVLGYCTRDNIDHFFLNWISKRKTSPAVNRRFVSAIQKYSDFWEDRPGFKVESALVKKGLDDAKVCKKRMHSQFSVHVDAHKHRPTLHHSPEQEMRMIQDALTNYAPSKYGFLPLGKNFLICWNCSILQKMSADGYDQWASETREAILEREAIIQESTSEDRKYEAMLRTTEHMVRRVIDLEQRIDSLRAEFKLEFVNLKNMLFQSQQHPVDHNRISHIAPSLPAHAITPINLNASTFRSRFDVSPIPMFARSLIETNVIATITDNFPSTPNIPPCIHKTVKENMEYWMTHKYWQYLNRNNTSLQKLGWDKNTQHRFCKRRDIAMWVKKVAENRIHANLSWENDTDIFIQVATDLDDERGDKTVTNALREFKNESEQSWIIKRTSRKNK